MGEIDLKTIRKNTSQEKKHKSPTGLNLEFLKKDIKFFGKKFGDNKKEKFYSELGVLSSSGIDLSSALEIIIEDEQSESLKAIFKRIHEDVIAGSGFSEALYKTGQFSDYEYYSIKVGEESGRLMEVLAELASFYELRVQQKRQITGALSYPILVTFVAIGAVIFMLNVVVPMFEGVFQRFGGELPLLTRKVLELSHWMKTHLVTGLIFFPILVILFIYIKRFYWFRRYSSLFLLRIPFIGRFLSKLMHARFCHSTALLTTAQVPLLDALEMVKKMIIFLPFQEAITNVQKYIEKGKHMYEGMENQKIFDHRLVSLTKVGEEVNSIGPLYSKLYSQYTAEVKYMTSVLGNMLEPVMILIVGLLVMVILIAMYLPLFQLSTTIR